MDERQALLAAILANPDEDTPRLAFADWLQEHGDKHDQARAEFIRLQCEAAKLPEKSAGRKKLETRAKALQRKHAKHWLGPIGELIAQKGLDRMFERGLLSSWYSTAGDFLKNPQHDILNEWLPKIGAESILLTEPSKKAAEIADSPALGGAIGLFWLRCKIGDGGLRAFANSPHTSRLSKFIVTQPGCTDAGLKAFAKSKAYPNLRRFGIRGGSRQDKHSYNGVLAVLKSDRFPKLDELDLHGIPPSNASRKAFFESEALSRLRGLWLGIGTEVRDVLACRHLANLEELGLYGCAITEAQALTLADSPTFAKLKKLTIYDANSRHPRLSNAATKRLRDRIGDGFYLHYSALSVPR